jgi:hypothetical protein
VTTALTAPKSRLLLKRRSPDIVQAKSASQSNIDACLGYICCAFVKSPRSSWALTTATRIAHGRSRCQSVYIYIRYNVYMYIYIYIRYNVTEGDWQVCCHVSRFHHSRELQHHIHCSSTVAATPSTPPPPNKNTRTHSVTQTQRHKACGPCEPSCSHTLLHHTWAQQHY